jgi:hypothetical protein
MAGARSTAPLNRSNSVFIVARLSAWDQWLRCTLTFPSANPAMTASFFLLL